MYLLKIYDIYLFQSAPEKPYRRKIYFTNGSFFYVCPKYTYITEGCIHFLNQKSFSQTVGVKQ